MNAIRKLTTVLLCVLLGTVVVAQVPSPTAPGPTGPGTLMPFNLPAGLIPAAAATSPTAAATPTEEKPAVNIAEAAGTLTDPMDFLYLSKEYVFNLLVLANSLGIPGVRFDPDSLPQLYEFEVADDGTMTRARSQTTEGTTGRGTRTRSGRSYETETVWLSGSTEGGRRTVRGARFLAGEEEPARTVVAPSEEGVDDMLRAITVVNNEDLTKLVEFVQDLPAWQRVGRLALPTTQKQKLDKAIVDIYAQAFRSLTSGGIGPQYMPGSPTSTYSEPSGEGGEGVPPPSAVPPPPPGAPPVDPQAVGEWYHFYQQGIAWERYVNEEVLLLKPGEPTSMYDLDTAIQPQEMFFMPPASPDAPPNMIHFDKKETPVALRLSAVKPESIQPALDQISRVMRDLALQNAKKDSDRNREFVARLDMRKERRFRYREWLNDQTTEIRKMAEDYRRRLAGDEFVIDGVQYLVSQKPLSNVPLNSRNIVTERLTPYDLLDNDGTLKKATEERVERSP